MLDYDFGRGGRWPPSCLFKACGASRKAGRRSSERHPVFTRTMTPGAERQVRKADQGSRHTGTLKAIPGCLVLL